MIWIIVYTLFGANAYVRAYDRYEMNWRDFFVWTTLWSAILLFGVTVVLAEWGGMLIRWARRKADKSVRPSEN